MASRSVHTSLARIAFALAPVFVILSVLLFRSAMRELAPPTDRDVFEVAAGTWGWTTGDDDCARNPHIIEFSADRQAMTLSYPESKGDSISSWIYDIIEHEPGRIRAAIRGEQRRTDAGVPVVWDLLLRGPNLYVWHRSDWPALASTGLIQRCDSTRARLEG